MLHAIVLTSLTTVAIFDQCRRDYVNGPLCSWSGGPTQTKYVIGYAS